jgi:hypothetical protein
VHVEHDHVDLLGVHRLARRRDRRRLEHTPPVELEIEPTEHPDRRVVVDDEHGVAG